MSGLYINKKIDNLGRIVIPKEIRKKLHIIENENLDITLENDKVIIKKTSDDLYNRRIFEIIINIIKKELDININIFNINRNYFNNTSIKLEENDFKEFLVNKKNIFSKYQVFPIYPNGILYGGIIAELKDEDIFYDDIIKCFQRFIEKYLEE